MKSSILLIVLLLAVSFNSCSQTNGKRPENENDNKVHVGGHCEGCEAIYESPVPLEKLLPVDTLPDFFEPGPKIEISGIIFQQDGRTPANGVILYVYHTNQQGLYSKKGNETGWGKRHGYIRGWMKTDKNGFYKFYTLVPASYPNSKNPKHIHPTIKEPGKNEYYIDEYLFEDDLLLPATEKTKAGVRGGNGVVKPYFKDGMLHALRDITLGLNIPDYPGPKKK